MRCDPKPVARRQLFAGREVGVAERVFGDDLAAMRDGDDAAWLLRCTHLKFDPVTDVDDRGLQPRFHVRSLRKFQMRMTIDEFRLLGKKCWRMLPDKTKPAQPFWVAPAEPLIGRTQ